MAIGALAFDLALPASPLAWLAFLVVGGARHRRRASRLRYLVALSAFWLLDGTGLSMLSGLLSMFFSGMLLPLTVFPGVLGEVVRVLPWAAMLQVPADVLLGEYRGVGAAARRFGFQAVWAVVLLAAGRAAAVGGHAEGGGPGWLSRRCTAMRIGAPGGSSAGPSPYRPRASWRG